MMENEKPTLTRLGNTLRTHLILLGGLIAFFWLVEIADAVIFNGSLDKYGVQPRSLIGLRGIIFAPFLHGGFAHLTANTIPFLIMGWFVLLRGTWEFTVVSVITAVSSGLGAWLFGAPNSVHIGVSGVIMGYFGYLMMRGYFERSLTAVVWSIFIVFLYGGLLWGVLPGQNGISWQSHLFGFLGGGLAAYLLAKGERPAGEWSTTS